MKSKQPDGIQMFGDDKSFLEKAALDKRQIIFK